MTNSLAIYQQFEQIQGAALAMHKSGFFKDVTSEAQAIVKVMAGAELGIPPFASMTGISIIQGKPTLGANLMASLVKNDPRYDYRVKQCDNEACVLEWFENGQHTGESAFTIEEAKAAGLAGKDNWKKYTSDMLFARAISRGTRRFAPGVFGGSPVYTPDELGADVDPEGYIEAQVVEVAPQQEREPVWNPEVFDATSIELFTTVINSNGTPYSEVSKDKLSFMATAIQKSINAFDPDLVDEEQQAELDHLQLKLDAAKYYMSN